MASTIVLSLTVMLNLSGIGARTAHLDFPDRYSSMADCQAAAVRLSHDLESPFRHVEAVCRQQM